MKIKKITKIYNIVLFLALFLITALFLIVMIYFYNELIKLGDINNESLNWIFYDIYSLPLDNVLLFPCFNFFKLVLLGNTSLSYAYFYSNFAIYFDCILWVFIYWFILRLMLFVPMSIFDWFD